MPPSKRNQLIDAAVRVFSRNGFHGSGLEAILSEAGVSRMTLYNHFASKDELIVAALARRDEEFVADLRRYVERHADGPRGRILAVFDYFEKWFARRDFEGCLLVNASGEFHDASGEVRAMVASSKRGLERYLESLCAATGAPDARGLAARLNMILQGAIVVAHTMDGVDGRRRAGETASALARELLGSAA